MFLNEMFLIHCHRPFYKALILLVQYQAITKERVSALVKLIPGLRPLDAGPLEMSRIVESVTALMISLNRRYKTHHSGIRITGLTA